jgi:uncharacterized repeat protein (TIGR03847 family)
MSDDGPLSPIESFVPGAVGEPGSRVFYLQARSGSELFSLRCEKQQVGQLGRYLTQIGEALGASVPDRDVIGMIEPVDPEWVVGEISVAVHDDSRLIVVRAEQMPVFDDDGEPVEDHPLEVAEFVLTAQQALGFGEAAEGLMAGGRPPCPLCGAPVNPTGHACPRWN